MKRLTIILSASLFLILLTLAIFLIIKENKNVFLEYTPIIINEDNAASSPMDLSLQVSPFTNEFTGQITLILGPREGYGLHEGEIWDNVVTLINSSSGIQIINPTDWETSISINDETKSYVLNVKVLEEGEHRIDFFSRQYDEGDYYIGDHETLYFLLQSGQLQVSSLPILLNSQSDSRTKAVPLCPSKDNC